MTDWTDAEYTLYSSPFSLYSMMARHTVQLGPTTHNAMPPKSIALSFVNHKAHENLSEVYLKVNPKGQVPSMTGSLLDHTLTDSYSISLHLAEKHYSAMLGGSHEDVVRDLFERLHAVYGLSISNNNPTPEMIKHNPSPVEKILERDDISAEYRKALEAKLAFHNKYNGVAFHPDVVAENRADVQRIFEEVVEHRRKSGTISQDDEWTFGAEVGPTILDSHILPFALRCMEVGNGLVPPELQRWAKAKEKSPLWYKVMRGRPTTYHPSMGPVAEMQDMMTL
ncbi:Ff.00g042430.m01.CDS01 [Fusarium sp. VM40]|nr:Ff.00g042430.m01.CDS01 [Fusarium sp. VM40]